MLPILLLLERTKVFNQHIRILLKAVITLKNWTMRLCQKKKSHLLPNSFRISTSSKMKYFRRPRSKRMLTKKQLLWSRRPRSKKRMLLKRRLLWRRMMTIKSFNLQSRMSLKLILKYLNCSSWTSLQQLWCSINKTQLKNCQKKKKTKFKSHESKLSNTQWSKKMIRMRKMKNSNLLNSYLNLNHRNPLQKRAYNRSRQNI